MNLLVKLLIAVTAAFCSLNSYSQEVVPNQYVVQLHDADALKKQLGLTAANEAQLIDAALKKLGVKPEQVKYKYDSVFLGFTVNVPLLQKAVIESSPLVKVFEPDYIVKLQATQTYNFWNLDRIDTVAKVYNSQYNYTLTGKGVSAYIIDTGIRATHKDFAGRMGKGYDAILGTTSSVGPGDCNGHGTHVAGSVGGTTWGVAKEVKLHAVKVLACNGSGTNSAVINGINWVAKNAVRPAVANLSLGGGASLTTDNAVLGLVQKGIVAVVAAGNSNADACLSSPARVAQAITVASSDKNDARSSFSNWGSCIDIFGPGSDIPSASYLSDTGSSVLSGTSMAAPHVAGAAAKLLQKTPTATPAQIDTALKNASTKGLITDPRGSVNNFLYSGD